MNNYLNPNDENLTFNVVELDVSDIWAEHRPCDDADWLEGEAKAETRNYVELAGGQLMALFIVD